MSFLRQGVTKQHKPILILMIALYTFSEEAEPNGSTGKQEPGLLNGQQHPLTIWNADEVCMF